VSCVKILSLGELCENSSVAAKQESGLQFAVEIYVVIVPVGVVLKNYKC